ncbi:Sporulation protein YtfJ [Syntrophomonas zehnderi OL-4]|uniref:Sporulation protein YtfJ n=1 Tax=Syntrophomonas zehnderi OL-4 TaxID=690567 RepID=A0A0E4GA57_9FIRM|nr:spore germination protein GerW family protein [Syntrophomonas zehnderi]CFX02037.1 Sporulation protein YtfJ [Syntrophomonas zehnderi OL-4]
MDLTQNIGVLFEELEKIFRTNTIVGEPITAGNVTVIPITSVSFGAGNAGADTQDLKGSDNSGGGAGAGGKITPVAVIVIKDDEVSVLPLSNRSTMDKIMGMVPDIVGKFKGDKNK